MADEQKTAGRCRWIGLGFVLFLVQGILPGSIMGGVAGLKKAGAVLGQHADSYLFSGLFALTGMIMALLLSAVVVMFLTAGANRVAGKLFRQTSSGTAGRTRATEE